MITVNYYSTVENNLALSNKTEAVHTLGLNNSSSKYAHVQLEKYTRILWRIIYHNNNNNKKPGNNKKSPLSVEWMTKLWNSHRLKQYSVKMNEFLPCAMTGYWPNKSKSEKNTNNLSQFIYSLKHEKLNKCVY